MHRLRIQRAAARVLLPLLAALISAGVAAQAPDPEPRWRSIASGGMSTETTVVLAGDEDGLYVAGDLTHTPDGLARGIARWDGARWHALGDGPGGVVVALARNPTVGDVFAAIEIAAEGGVTHRRVMRWDGSTWHALGQPVDGRVRALAWDRLRGRLLAGFATAFNPGDRPEDWVGRSERVLWSWEGQAWTPLGGAIWQGVDGLPGSPSVSAIAIDPGTGDVVAGGVFSGVGGSSAASIARWDGVSWSGLAGGLAPVPGGTAPLVRALAVAPGRNGLVVGGQFVVPGDESSRNLARWSNGTWTALASPVEGVVTALAVSSGRGDMAVGEATASSGDASGAFHVLEGLTWRSDLVAAGRVSGVAWFAENHLALVGPGFRTSEEARAGRLIRTFRVWRDGRWSAPGAATGLRVDSVAWGPDGRLHAAGELSSIDGLEVETHAVWDGERWAPAPGAPDLGIRLLRRDRVSGALVAAGNFTRLGEVAFPGLARWDGVEWRPLGGAHGLTSVSALAQHPLTGQWAIAGPAPGGMKVMVLEGEAWVERPGSLRGSASALAWGDDADALYLGGYVLEPGETFQSLVLAWRDGAWAAIDEGLSGDVYALHVDRRSGRLLAGGGLAGMGGVAEWDGAAWRALGAGAPAQVRGFVELPDGDLVAGGIVTLGAPGLGRWDGLQWRPLGAGPEASPGFRGWSYALAVSPDGGTLAVGGQLGLISGQPSALSLGLLDGVVDAAPVFSPPPTIWGWYLVGQPLSVIGTATDPEGAAVVHHYQWLREGAPIPGATGASYTVTLGDIGARLAVRIDASDARNRTRIVVGPIGNVMTSNRAPVFEGRPSITGYPAAGSVLGLTDLETYDPDGDRVTLSVRWLLDGAPMPGQTGMTLTVPAGIYARSVRAEISASDGRAVTTWATASVVIRNAAPIARTDTWLGTLTPLLSVPQFLLRNDSDPEGDPMVASLLAGPAVGTAQVSPDGSLLLTGLPTDAPYSDRLTYRVCDRSGACSTGILHLEFEAPAWQVPQHWAYLASEHEAFEMVIGSVGASRRAVAEVVDLRLAPSRGYGVLPAGRPGVVEVHLPPNPADFAARYSVHVEGYAGPGGDASVRVDAVAVADPSLACTGPAGRRSTCTLQATVPAHSPGVVLRYEVETLAPNTDPDIGIVARHLVEHLDAVGIHGRASAVVAKHLEVGAARVRVVSDIAAVHPGQTLILGAVEVRDGPGGALLGRQTLLLGPQVIRPAPRALVPGRPAFLPLARYQAYDDQVAHMRARLDVPAGATAAMVEVEAPAGVTGALVAPSAEPSEPRAQAVAMRPAASSARVPLVRAQDGRLVGLLEGPILVPGAWTLVLEAPQATAGIARVDATLSLGAGAMPLRPGHYFNPARDGHGIFLERGGSQMVAWWYTYQQDGSPTWYMAQADAPADGQPFAADAYRVTWSAEGGATLHDVGQVAVTPAADGSLGFAYEVDGATGHERLVSLSEGGCLPIDGVSVDGAGSWFSPERSGFGYSVMWDARTSQEIMVTYAYDADGLPRWGYAQAPANPAAVAELPIVQLSGFAPDAAWRPLVNLGRIGTLRRTIGTMPQDGQPGLRRASVAMAFTGPVTGAFVQDLETALLTDRRSCR